MPETQLAPGAYRHQTNAFERLPEGARRLVIYLNAQMKEPDPCARHDVLSLFHSVTTGYRGSSKIEPLGFMNLQKEALRRGLIQVAGKPEFAEIIVDFKAAAKTHPTEASNSQTAHIVVVDFPLRELLDAAYRAGAQELLNQIHQDCRVSGPQILIGALQEIHSGAGGTEYKEFQDSNRQSPIKLREPIAWSALPASVNTFIAALSTDTAEAPVVSIRDIRRVSPFGEPSTLPKTSAEDFTRITTALGEPFPFRLRHAGDVFDLVGLSRRIRSANPESISAKSEATRAKAILEKEMIRYALAKDPSTKIFTNCTVVPGFYVSGEVPAQSPRMLPARMNLAGVMRAGFAAMQSVSGPITDPDVLAVTDEIFASAADLDASFTNGQYMDMGLHAHLRRVAFESGSMATLVTPVTVTVSV